jgi:8-oxo-dGTP pyrophosphatase MutT (NUDIX family)
MDIENKQQKQVYVDWIERVKVLQKAAVFNKNGKILALKRMNDQKRPNPNCWDLVGGRVEASDIEKCKDSSGRGDNDDILINSLKREIKEETNLEVGDICVINAASAFSEKKGSFIIVIGYVCRAINENDLKLSEEHVDYRWVAKDEFLKLDIGDDGGLLEAIMSKV